MNDTDLNIIPKGSEDMGYTCTIHTDYVDPTQTEERLNRVTNIISSALLENEKNAPSGTGIPSGADKNYSSAL